jgi:hypothetical protein
MLCEGCVAEFRGSAGRRELADYQNAERSLEYRRHAAIILVTLARSRKARPPLPQPLPARGREGRGAAGQAAQVYHECFRGYGNE